MVSLTFLSCDAIEAYRTPLTSIPPCAPLVPIERLDAPDSACGDTVKKPKLDKHYSMCHSSVTCLDCSTTFAGPAQCKSHTQCISEAEKYQKGLYKGPKMRLLEPEYITPCLNPHASSHTATKRRSARKQQAEWLREQQWQRW